MGEMLNASQERQFHALWDSPSDAFRAILMEYRHRLLEEAGEQPMPEFAPPTLPGPFDDIPASELSPNAPLLARRLRKLDEEVHEWIRGVARRTTCGTGIAAFRFPRAQPSKRTALRLAEHLADPAVNCPMQPVPLAIHLIRSGLWKTLLTPRP